MISSQARQRPRVDEAQLRGRLAPCVRTPLRGSTGAALVLLLAAASNSAPTIFRKAATMAEVHFTDITIVGNSPSKPPRKDGKNTEGVDRFVITFSLSKNAKAAWVETFNQVWGERSRQTSLLPLPVVSDDQIQITCPLDDRLQSHVDALKREVATTNQLYREYLQAMDDEKRAQDELLQQLRF
jgi:hypothetical protein